MSASCEHLNEFLRLKGSDSYNLIHSFFIVSIAKGSRKRKAEDCYCNICSGRNRLHACMDCAHFGCYPEHIRKHSDELQHYLAVEISYGAVFCFICSDYMYHSELMSIAKKNKMMEAKIYGTNLYALWEPTSEEMQVVKKLTGGSNLSGQTFSGLRGIYNFGNTCYISCVVQVLVHTPLLRDYFLGDRHVCKLSENCMVCEMITICQKFYSGQRQFLVLENLLYLIFKTLIEFSEVGQHDVVEFFTSFIDILCKHSRGISETSEKCLPVSGCDCIFHKTFSSLIWEDMVCEVCSSHFENSPSESSLFCFSLDLGSEGANDGEKKTVVNCLNKYTSKQSCGYMKFCIKCAERKAALKQQTIRRLPIVACLHLERLLHKTWKCKSKGTTFWKNSASVEFEDCLDLSPFLSSVCSESHKKKPEPAYNILNECDKSFSLYAIVTHSGNADGGHLTTYLKMDEDEWYLCDDEKVSKVETEKVFLAEGYLLFYHKKILDYELDTL